MQTCPKLILQVEKRAIAKICKRVYEKNEIGTLCPHEIILPNHFYAKENNSAVDFNSLAHKNQTCSWPSGAKMA